MCGGCSWPERMGQRWLKPVRLAVALAVSGGLTLAFLDFRDTGWAVAARHLAGVQLVPALVALTASASLLTVLVVAGLAVVTLLAGRVYCSAVCPLGVLQDGLRRVLGRGRKRALPHQPPADALRYGSLAVALAGVVAGWTGLTLALLDPYSHFGRIVAGLLRPLAIGANNLVADGLAVVGAPQPYRADLSGAGGMALALPLAVVCLLGGLVWWRGRLFCNTLCPVGTVLGLVARVSAWRLAIDPAACRRCGDCLRACKAGCIDVRGGSVDASRCVGCFNCIEVCNERAIGLRRRWRRPVARAQVPAPVVASANERRRFVAGAAVLAMSAATAGAAWLTRRGESARGDPPPAGAAVPPGAGSLDGILARCTACHLCVSACPTQVLRPALLELGAAGWLHPRLDYTRAFCNYDCRRCAEVCPDGALVLLPLAEKQVTRLGRAELVQRLCVVERDGTDCAACSEHCPTKAVDTVPYRAGLRLPQINAELCIGCGACEFACPVKPQKAITVKPLRRHERAKRAEEQPAKPPPKGGFPF